MMMINIGAAVDDGVRVSLTFFSSVNAILIDHCCIYALSNGITASTE